MVGDWLLAVLSLRCIDLLYRQVTAGRLPGVVLLEIFGFYFAEEYQVDYWHTLVHVCQRWRNVVFSSPRRLNLQLFCTPGRPIAEIFNIWPELPIFVSYDGPPRNTDDVVAALKLKGFVSGIDLTVKSGSAAEWETFAAEMQDPFPMLENLRLRSFHDDMKPVISDSFFGGSAPRLRLQYLLLSNIVFPALPNLLLSATDLVELRLWDWDIPHSGYISPEAMVTNISALTRLKLLSLHFQSPRSRPDGAGQLLPPLMRTPLPSLTDLDFRGVTEYLEDLVTRIDVPLLNRANITLFNQLVFDISQFPNLTCRTEKFKVLDQADVFLDSYFINIKLLPKGGTINPIWLKLGISCIKLDWQLSALAQVCNSCLPTLSSLERLRICDDDRYLPPLWKDDMESPQWLEMLRPFVTVKDLYLSKKVARRVAAALQGLSDSEELVTEVLPALQDIFIESLQPSGLIQEVFHKFVTVRGRQVSCVPVAIHSWVREKARWE